MKRFKTGFQFFFTFLFAGAIGLSLHADKQFVGYSAYWDPDGNRHSSDSQYVTPACAYLISDMQGYDYADFTAAPVTGWSVDYWCKSNVQIDPWNKDIIKIQGSEGQLVYTQHFDGTGAIYLGVRFSHLKYDLVYDGNGAVSPARMQDVVYTNKYSLEDAPIAPTGMTFAGWSDASDTVFQAGEEVSGASFAKLNDVHVDGHVVKLTALWATNSYTVSFNPNGGGVTPESRKVRYGDPIGELPSLAWAGHVFLGWFDSDDHQVTAETKLTTASNLVLTAKWSLANYVISFVNVGDGAGSFSPQSSFSAEYGSTVTVTAVPDQESSEFKGWTDGVLTAQRSVTVVSNATYEAKIDLKRHTVTFSWELPTGDTTNDIQTVKHGMAATVPVVVELPGYNFKWDTDASVYSHVTRDLTIKGEYTGQRYYLTFAVDGGDGHGQLDHLSNFYEYGTKLTVTAKPDADSDFMRWEDGDISNPREIIVQAAATYTAVFDLKRFDVTFNWKTGANVETQEVQRVAWGTAATPPADAVVDSRIGYSWNGWNIPSDEFASVKSNMTVSATYEPHHYTVRYDVTGSKGDAPESQTFAYDERKGLRQCLLKSDENLDFWAWKHAETGEVYVQLAGGFAAMVSNLTAEADGVVTLKALWDVGDLSRAMKCDNLYWREADDFPGWKPGEESAVWHGNQPYADMLTEVKTNGVLSFDWKVDQTPFIGSVDLIAKAAILTPKTSVAREGWIHVEFEVPQDAPADQPDPDYGFPLELRISFKNENGALLDGYVRNVTWTPAGGNPEPKPENAVTISSAEIVGSQFKLSFTSDAKFDYNLLTNANLLIDSWGVWGERKVGDGKLITFEPEIQSGVPQMFYKVETIRKK